MTVQNKFRPNGFTQLCYEKAFVFALVRDDCISLSPHTKVSDPELRATLKHRVSKPRPKHLGHPPHRSTYAAC